MLVLNKEYVHNVDDQIYFDIIQNIDMDENRFYYVIENVQMNIEEDN